MGYPPPPQVWTDWKYYLPPSFGWRAVIKCGGGHPIPGPGRGVLRVPPPRTRSWLDRTAQRVLATRRAVCLLRSRRRTVLYKYIIYKKVLLRARKRHTARCVASTGCTVPVGATGSPPIWDLTRVGGTPLYFSNPKKMCNSVKHLAITLLADLRGRGRGCSENLAIYLLGCRPSWRSIPPPPPPGIVGQLRGR